MTAKTTFSVSYYCRKSKQNKQGQAPLELCININGERIFANLPAKFFPKEFNKKRKPAYIEELLNQYKIKVNEVITDLMSNNLPITAPNIRDYLRTGGTKSYTIRDLCNEYLGHIKNKMNIPIYKRYELASDFLCAELGADKQLASISNADMVRVYDALKVKYLSSTSAGYMIKIKTILTYAFDNGLIRVRPFNGIKINKGIAKIGYLSSDDLNKIKSVDLCDYPKLDKVRDLLIFQCSTGLAYCDMVNFDSSLIKRINGVYIYCNKRQKTNVEFTSVIMADGMEVLNKYNGQLPLISNQKYNSYLKELQRLAGINTVITTHLCRKTYAHHMLNSGVKIDTVARLLGHSNSNITQRIYCRKTTETIASEVAQILQ